MKTKLAVLALTGLLASSAFAQVNSSDSSMPATPAAPRDNSNDAQPQADEGPSLNGGKGARTTPGSEVNNPDRDGKSMKHDSHGTHGSGSDSSK
ncbi:hypothetical protein IQ22_00271 [Pseudomonas duriflava]|uniref:Uncharacterized protein n=1 Tax=Pseudomonas duriflava TaxID=459528 RepID=A0A562QPD9_9PSED|nr:hypothetical protein [Pseudomonas duriflava]TWI58565.1 hypothetical protein IQ22_00271 [Pseudomonas duriflava]